MSIRSEDIIFLLGAGASADAGIPTSAKMLHNIEDLLIEDPEWNKYRKLYLHVKSAINYAAGLQGAFNEQVSYNIETLVNTLYELERNEDHPLYPFMATWNYRFVTLAGDNFDCVRDFRKLILKMLKKWMYLDDTSKGDYYRGFVQLQKELNYPLFVFSLNYDLCVERLDKLDFKVETGFEGYGSSYTWDWTRFERGESKDYLPPEIYLYKLHGSIDWKRDSNKRLFSVEDVESVHIDEMELIFGRDFKLEAADPYLFCAYQFRKYVLETKLIVIVGYGFDDTHVNTILAQGLLDDPERKVIAICRCNKADVKKRVNTIAKKLLLEEKNASQVVVHPGTAKKFFELLSDKERMTEFFDQHMPEEEEDIPF